MNSVGTLIILLCKICPRRNGICGEHPPSWTDARGCKSNEAERLAKELDQELKRMQNSVPR